MKARMLNAYNAWTWTVPSMEKFAKVEGKKNLFGTEKTPKAHREFLKRLRVVVLGLYADGQLGDDSSFEDCLQAIVKSLVAFKEAHPNWPRAYVVGYRTFIADSQGVPRLCRQPSTKDRGKRDVRDES
jgi:hypothetical protein